MAKTKECPSCAMEVKSNSKACPICGYEFPTTDRWIKVLAVLLLIAFLYLMLF